MLYTPNYAAPELHLAAELDVTDRGTIYPYTGASDAWSCGIVIAEMLSEDADRCVVVSAEDPCLSARWCAII